MRELILSLKRLFFPCTGKILNIGKEPLPAVWSIRQTQFLTYNKTLQLVYSLVLDLKQCPGFVVDSLILRKVVLKILKILVPLLDPQHQLAHYLSLLLKKGSMLCKLNQSLLVTLSIRVALPNLDQSLFEVAALHEEPLQIEDFLLQFFLLFDFPGKVGIPLLQILFQLDFVPFNLNVFPLQFEKPVLINSHFLPDF